MYSAVQNNADMLLFFAVHWMALLSGDMKRLYYTLNKVKKNKTKQ